MGNKLSSFLSIFFTVYTTPPAAVADATSI